MDVAGPTFSYSGLDPLSMSSNGMRRDTGTFGDTVSFINACIQSWSPCEQSIAIYSILWNLRPSQVKFLSVVIDSIIRNYGDTLSQVETDANNPEFINSLHRIGEERALEDLLTFIQLLRPGNEPAVKEYMNLLPKVLLYSTEEVTYLGKCRQLISIALVHPAFNTDQKKNSLAFWLQRLDEKWRKQMDRAVPRVHNTVPLYKPPALQKPKYIPPPVVERTVSHPPAQVTQHQIAQTVGEPTNRPPNVAESVEEPDEVTKLERHGSQDWTDTNGVDLLGTFDRPGMKQVPMWLKSLRLHKYQDLFKTMSYDEMLTVSDGFLHDNNVTTGARNKIIQNVKSLSQREETLSRIEQEIISAKQPSKQSEGKQSEGKQLPKVDVFKYFEDLNQVLSTPMMAYTAPPVTRVEEEENNDAEEEHKQNRVSPKKEEDKARKDSSNSGSSSDEDSSSSGDQDQDDYGDLLLKKDIPPENLPMLIARVMSRVREFIYSSQNIEDYVMEFIKLLDKGLCHEAFQAKERKLFFEWRAQMKHHNKLEFSSNRRNWNKGFGSYTFSGMPSRGGGGTGCRKPNTLGRNQRMRRPGAQTAGKSSTVPRLGHKQLSIGPFNEGVPLAPPFYGGSMGERSSSYNQLSGVNETGSGSSSNIVGANHGPRQTSSLTSTSQQVGAPRLAPQYIKSKEETASDDHIRTLCLQMANKALSDDYLDGMSFSLSGK